MPYLALVVLREGPRLVVGLGVKSATLCTPHSASPASFIAVSVTTDVEPIHSQLHAELAQLAGEDADIGRSWSCNWPMISAPELLDLQHDRA